MTCGGIAYAGRAGSSKLCLIAGRSTPAWEGGHHARVSHVLRSHMRSHEPGGRPSSPLRVRGCLWVEVSEACAILQHMVDGVWYRLHVPGCGTSVLHVRMATKHMNACALL